MSIGERVVDISGARALCFVAERGRAGCLCHELAALPCAEGRESGSGSRMWRELDTSSWARPIGSAS
ncbi:MAG TPA: hypothetical protein DEF51_18095 [Myxococcales bacterium]|nr:hypothetical protein [Myxococcales bacterium]